MFAALLVAFGALYAWRMSGVLEMPPVTDHLSNLYLSGAAATLVSGPRAFTSAATAGDRTREAVAIVVLVAVNVVAEIALAVAGVDDEVNAAMGDVNTSDAVDAAFGLLGCGMVALAGWRGRGARNAKRPGPKARPLCDGRFDQT